MGAAWVAGTVRAQAISRRRVGTAAARAVAASDSLGVAVEALARSPYGRRMHPGDTLAAATQGIESTLLWNLRVLAGWLPASGAEMLRVLAGWFEIANVEDHLRSFTALPTQPPFPLGALATAWSRLATTASRDELRAALAASPWGDPGAPTPRAVHLSMRLIWAERVATRVPAGHAWSLGAAALLVAREQIARRRPLPERAAATANPHSGNACDSGVHIGWFVLEPADAWSVGPGGPDRSGPIMAGRGSLVAATTNRQRRPSRRLPLHARPDPRRRWPAGR